MMQGLERRAFGELPYLFCQRSRENRFAPMRTLRDQFETAITDNPTGACKV